MIHRIYIKEESFKKFNQSWVSPRNKQFYQIRKQNNNESVFESVKYEDGNLTMIFKVTPTYGGGTKEVKGVDLSGNDISLKYYTYMVQLAGIEKKFEGWNELKFKDKRDKIFNWLDTWNNTKLYSNDKSFFGQGSWYRLDKKHAAIFPFPSGFQDKGIWQAKHGRPKYVTKHFLNVYETIKFNASDIIKAIDKVV